MAPRDLALSRPSPRGKKNFRGAPGLRQIDRGNSSLTQVSPDVIAHVHTVAPWPARKRSVKAQLANAGIPAQTVARGPWPAKTSDGSFCRLRAPARVVPGQAIAARRAPSARSGSRPHNLAAAVGAGPASASGSPERQRERGSRGRCPPPAEPCAPPRRCACRCTSHWGMIARRSDFDGAYGTLAAAQNQPATIQQIAVGGDTARICKSLVIQVRATLGDRPPRR